MQHIMKESHALILYALVISVAFILLSYHMMDRVCHVYPHGAPDWVYPIPKYGEDQCSPCPFCNYEDIVASHPFIRYPEMPRNTMESATLVLDWQEKHGVFDHPVCYC